MVDPAKPALTGIGPETLTGLLGGSGRAREPWRYLRAGQDPFERMTDGPLARLGAACSGSPLGIERLSRSGDGTIKQLFALADGAAIESVLIPAPLRSTVCISTQVGCARGCTFCRTATLGLGRNLCPAEIVAQVTEALRLCARESLPPLRNIVLMGMGEPLDNLDAVRTALEIITHPHGLAFGPRHITVSTVAPSPQRVRDAATLPARLAWSLVAVEDQLRRRLIPSARHPLVELRDAFADGLARRRRYLFVEVTLIRGINDREEHARALADFLAPLHPQVRVNLLPLNPIGTAMQPSEPDQVARFQQHLRERGYVCIVRRARGGEENAACGQLAASW